MTIIHWPTLFLAIAAICAASIPSVYRPHDMGRCWTAAEITPRALVSVSCIVAYLIGIQVFTGS